MVSSIASAVASSATYASMGVASARRAGGVSEAESAPGSERKQRADAATAAPQLSAAEQQQIEELQRIDRKVQAHEMAHMAAGAGLVRGGVTYGYEMGPDGKRYAVSGEVSIDASPADTPERTIAKAARIQAAALAPADPSAQDRRVAAAASQMAVEARMAMASQQRTAAIGNDRDQEASGGQAAYDRHGQTGVTPTLGQGIDAFA